MLSGRNQIQLYIHMYLDIGEALDQWLDSNEQCEVKNELLQGRAFIRLGVHDPPPKEQEWGEGVPLARGLACLVDVGWNLPEWKVLFRGSLVSRSKGLPNATTLAHFKSNKRVKKDLATLNAYIQYYHTNKVRTEPVHVILIR